MQSLRKKIEEITSSLSRSDERGFTIIEVMIVLVIAAIIILIVFLAVPALQRNSRNNQRKSDAARVSAAVTEFVNNSSGTLPSANSQITGYVGTLAIYTLPTSGLSALIVNATANETVSTASDIKVRKQATCQTSGTNIGKAATGGTARQFVVLYAVEAGGTAIVPQCIAS